MISKKVFSFIACLLIFTMLAACQPQVVEITKQVVVTQQVLVTAAPDRPQLSSKALLNPGEIVLAADFGAPPNQFITPEGVMDGVNPDLCGSIAAKLGLKIKWQNLSFPGLIPGLQANRFDALCTGVFINEDRKQIMNMVPYMQFGGGLLVKAGNPKGLTCKPTLGQDASFDACFEKLIGQKVSVAAAGTTFNQLDAYNKKFAAAGKGAITLATFDSNAEAFQALVNDQVAAFYASDPQCTFFALQNPGKYELAFQGYAPSPLSIVTLKANRELADAMKWALEQMKKEGSYQKILTKWGVASVDSFEIQVAK